MDKGRLKVVAWVTVVVFLTGCATIRKAKRAGELEKELLLVNERLKDCEDSKVSTKNELSSLEQAKLELERRLKNELSEYKAKLEMTERGLVLTFLSEIFFDSGKDEIRAVAKPTLQSVAEVLKENVSESLIAIEGHTDNDPIKYSGWRSNWELASARALSVLHYFAEECDIDSQRLSANSYGEYRPVNDNDTAQGRQKNRRVEIVIFPSKITKVQR